MHHTRRPTISRALVALALLALLGAACTPTGGGSTPLVITTTSWNQWIIGQDASFLLVATGARRGLTWSVTDGALPPGVALDPATGVVSGSASGPSTSQAVQFTATDGAGRVARRLLPVLVGTADVPSTPGVDLPDPARVDLLARDTGQPDVSSAWTYSAGALVRTPASWPAIARMRVSVSPDARTWIDSALGGGPVRARSTADGSVIRVLESTTARVESVAFSPDGRYLATVSEPGGMLGISILRIYRTSDWVEVRTEGGYDGRAIWSPASDRVAVHSTDTGDAVLVPLSPAELPRVVGTAGYGSCLQLLAWTATDRLVRTCLGTTGFDLVTQQAADDSDARAILTCTVGAGDCSVGELAIGAAGSPTGRWLALATTASLGSPSATTRLAVLRDAVGETPVGLIDATATLGTFPLSWTP